MLDLCLLSYYVLFVLFSGQVQHKLNRIATASGSANASVAMSALLDVMADAHTKSAGREQEPEQVCCWRVRVCDVCICVTECVDMMSDHLT